MFLEGLKNNGLGNVVLCRYVYTVALRIRRAGSILGRNEDMSRRMRCGMEMGDGVKKSSCDLTSLDEDGQDGKKGKGKRVRPESLASNLTEWATTDLDDRPTVDEMPKIQSVFVSTSEVKPIIDISIGSEV